MHGGVTDNATTTLTLTVIKLYVFTANSCDVVSFRGVHDKITFQSQNHRCSSKVGKDNLIAGYIGTLSANDVCHDILATAKFIESAVGIRVGYKW